MEHQASILSSSAGVVWYCKQCRKEMSVRDGSVFACVRSLPLRSWVLLMDMWANERSTSDIMMACGMKRRTVNKVSTIMTSVCLAAMKTEPLGLISSPNSIVAVDETNIRKAKVSDMSVGYPHVWVMSVLSPPIRQGDSYTITRFCFPEPSRKESTSIMLGVWHH